MILLLFFIFMAMKHLIFILSILFFIGCSNSSTESKKNNKPPKKLITKTEPLSAKLKNRAKSNQQNLDKNNNTNNSLNNIRQISFDSKKAGKSNKGKTLDTNGEFVQPPPAEASPNATVFNPDVRVATTSKGGSKIKIVKDGGKGQDYSKLPNFSKAYKPGKVTEACLFNLAGGRVSEARKFTSTKVAKGMMLNGGDGGPIIKNLKVTILEEKIEGNKAYVKFEDNASDYYSYHTLTFQNERWVITDTKTEKK